MTNATTIQSSARVAETKAEMMKMDEMATIIFVLIFPVPSHLFHLFW